MHKFTILSFTTITLACLLVGGALTGKNANMIEDIILNMDISIDEMEEQLKTYETNIFGKVIKNDSQTDFFVDFTRGKGLEEIREDTPKDLSELNKIIEDIVNVHYQELSAADFSGFMKSVEQPIKNYLIYKILVNNEEVDYQKLIVNFTESLTTILKNNVKEFKNLKKAANILINNIKSYIFDFFNNWTMIKNLKLSKNLESNENNICKSTVESSEAIDIDSEARAHANNLYLNEIIRETETQKMVSLQEFIQRTIANEYDDSNKTCNEFIIKTLEYLKDKLVEPYNDGNIAKNNYEAKTVKNVILHSIATQLVRMYIKDSQKKLAHNKFFINYLNERKNKDGLKLTELNNKESLIQSATGIYLLEYLNAKYIDLRKSIGEEQYNQIAKNDFADIDYEISDDDFGHIINNLLTISSIMNNKVDLIYRTYKAFELPDVTNSAELEFKFNDSDYQNLKTFHNLTLQFKTTYSGEIENGRIIQHTNEFLDTLDQKEENTILNEVFPIYKNNDYFYMKMLLVYNNSDTPIKFSIDDEHIETLLYNLNAEIKKTPIPVLSSFFYRYIKSKNTDNISTQFDEITIDELKNFNGKEITIEELYKANNEKLDISSDEDDIEAINMAE